MKRLLLAALLLAPLAAFAQPLVPAASQPGPSPGGLGISAVTDANGNVVNGTRQMNVTGTGAFISNPAPGTGVVSLAVNPFAGATVANSGCDLWSQGCVASFSVVARTTQTYRGPLMQFQRADGKTASFTPDPLSGIVNIPAIHAFCDGYDCGFAVICNNNNNCADAYTQTNFYNMPLLGWEPNGLPVIVGGVDLWIDNTGLPSSGRFMRDLTIATAITNFPTTASQTFFVTTENSSAVGVDLVSSSSDNAAQISGGTGTGDCQGCAFAPVVYSSSPNVPTTPSGQIFGDVLESGTPAYLWGAYPQGFAQLAGVVEYSQPNQEVLAELLTSSCVPTPGVLCHPVTTYAGTSVVPINTGHFGKPILRMCQGTDNTTVSCRLQDILLAGYATSATENASVLNSFGYSRFPKKPSPCGINTALATTGPLTGTNNTGFNGPVVSYIGRPVLNTQNLLLLWSTNLINSDWNNQLFGVQRADNGTPYDIYPLGCDADAGQITTDLSGTTGTVPHIWDQTGHNWNARTHDTLTQPTLSATGINGGPCVQFTPAANITTTASVDPGSPAGTPGLLTVTATNGVLQVGMVTGTMRNAVILSQLTGTTGSTGTYSITDPAGSTVASGTMIFSASPYMTTQAHVFGNSSVGLSKNMTVEVVFQTGASAGNFGALMGSPAGWWFGASGNTLSLAVGHNGATDLVGQTWTANTAHFAWFTIDGSSPANITIGLDGQAVATGTSSALVPLASGSYFTLGQSVSGQVAGGLPHLNGCIAMAALYNDIEPAANIAAMRAMAQQEWGTP